MHGRFDCFDEKISHHQVELLTYPACPESATEWSWFEADDANPRQRASVSVGAVTASDGFEKLLADEKLQSFEAGREQGQSEGRQIEREDQAAAQGTSQAKSARQIAELIASFAQERDRYMQAVEYEVVRLALAIAARILRREAQMDPLLLTGAVRVALGQLSGATEARLLVPAAELDLWSDAMAHLPNLPVRPSVQPGEGMSLGECMLETRLGSVDLGIGSQLAEIERGFFDRMPAHTDGTSDEKRNSEKNS